MLGKTKEGIQHYEVRQKDWTKGAIIFSYFFSKALKLIALLHFQNQQTAQLLLSHNWWHYAVYHIERNEFEKADQIFQDSCLPICIQDGNMFNIVDSASYLYRMRLIEESPSEEFWNKVHSRVEPHLKKHAGGFSDMHLMMSCLGSKRYDQAEQLIETLDKDDPIYAVTNTVLSAMYNHERGKDDLYRNTFRNYLIIASS